MERIKKFIFRICIISFLFIFIKMFFNENFILFTIQTVFKLILYPFSEGATFLEYLKIVLSGWGIIAFVIFSEILFFDIVNKISDKIKEFINDNH